MISLLDPQHIRVHFDCGQSTLNDYLKFQVNQDFKRKLAVCYVLTRGQNQEVLAYYTLSNHGLPMDHFPTRLQKKFPPSYTTIPTVLLGRFAVDKSVQGQGIGTILLVDALKKCHALSKSIGIFAVVLDPIDASAARFYEKHGFIRLPDSQKMILPTQSLGLLF